MGIRSSKKQEKDIDSGEKSPSAPVEDKTCTQKTNTNSIKTRKVAKTKPFANGRWLPEHLFEFLQKETLMNEIEAHQHIVKLVAQMAASNSCVYTKK